MKARVIATGEIVEISESSTIYDAGMCHICNASELENVPDINPDYWTRLEHQAAIAAMQGLVTRGEVLGSSVQQIARDITEISCEIAHALVEKYKKEERK